MVVLKGVRVVFGGFMFHLRLGTYHGGYVVSLFLLERDLENTMFLARVFANFVKVKLKMIGEFYLVVNRVFNIGMGWALVQSYFQEFKVSMNQRR